MNQVLEKLDKSPIYITLSLLFVLAPVALVLSFPAWFIKLCAVLATAGFISTCIWFYKCKKKVGKAAILVLLLWYGTHYVLLVQKSVRHYVGT